MLYGDGAASLAFAAVLAGASVVTVLASALPFASILARTVVLGCRRETALALAPVRALATMGGGLRWFTHFRVACTARGKTGNRSS